MKIDKDHGRALSARLNARGAEIIQQSGVLFMAAYHGIDLPLKGYELDEAERAARDVLKAIEDYRKATEPEPDDPVIEWARPIWHRPARGPTSAGSSSRSVTMTACM